MCVAHINTLFRYEGDVNFYTSACHMHIQGRRNGIELDVWLLDSSAAGYETQVEQQLLAKHETAVEPPFTPTFLNSVIPWKGPSRDSHWSDSFPAFFIPGD